MKQVFLFSVLIVILYGDLNQSNSFKTDDVTIKATTMKKGLRVIINEQEYRVVKLEKEFKVFQNIKGKEKEQVLKKIEEYKTELLFEEMVKSMKISVGVSADMQMTSGPDLPPCEIFNKDKLELFKLVGLQSPDSGEFVCKEEKDLIDMDLSKDRNSSKNE